jgi:predicted Co/Zn/Cd cation transporter (cation efflux family)
MARSGRTVFVEIDLVAGPKLAVQTVARQDELRRRIWEAVGLPLERAWRSIALTAGPNWA